MTTVNIKDFARYMCLVMLQSGMTVSPLKLQKLLYYQQAWHMVFFGRENTLFDCAPEAWVNGPVYPVIYKIYRDKVSGMCDHLGYQDFGCIEQDASDVCAVLLGGLGLSETENELLMRVIMLYGSKTQNQLIFMTHSEKPWSEARGTLRPFERSDRVISMDTMYAYYNERYQRNHSR